MLDLCQHVWFPHTHRSIVQKAQNCRQCPEQGKNLKPIIGTKHSFHMEPVVEPNEDVQLDSAVPLPDELNRDAYILVAIDRWSKISAAKQNFFRIQQRMLPFNLCKDAFLITGYLED